MANAIVRTVGVPVVLGYAVFIGAQTAESSTQYTSLQQRTTLTKEGNSPFHLKLDVQLFDIDGKASGSGTVEEWWISPQQYRVEYTAGGQHFIAATGDEVDAGKGFNRDAFLLHEALEQMSAPLGPLQTGEGVRKDARTMAGYKFDCLNVVSAPTPEGEFYACVSVHAPVLRISGRAFETVVRDKVAVFHETEVPLLFSMSFGTRPALTAKVSALSSLAADAADTLNIVKEQSPSSGPSQKHPGKVLNKVAPEYPSSARLQRESGTVVLLARIAKAGNISDLVPVASPDTSLTESAMNAVRRWRYEPFLLNGQPTEVKQIIVVNFHM